MEENKVCTTCAGKLEFNTLIGFYECKSCGKIYSVTEEDLKPASLASVNRLMLDHKYDEAQNKIRSLLEADPDNVMLHLHSFLCRKRAVSTNQLLVSACDSEEQIRQVRDDPDWDKIRTINGGRGSKLTDLVREFCDDQLKMSELRRKYGPEIESGIVKDVPAANEKRIRTIPKYILFPISLIIWCAIVIPISFHLASVNHWFIEDWSWNIGYYQRLKNEDAFILSEIGIILALTVFSTLFVSVFMKRRIQRLAKNGRIRILKDGTPVKVTSEFQDHSVYLKPDQMAIREYRELKFRCETIIEGIRKEEARLMTDS